MTDPPDPPPVTIQVTAAIAGHVHVTARATATPFRVRLIEACSAALERLEAMSRAERNIFAETGEVFLFWLHALGDDGAGVNRLSPGLQWAPLGHVVLNRVTHLGVITYSGGTGKFRWFHARAIVNTSIQPVSVVGDYHFRPGAETKES